MMDALLVIAGMLADRKFKSPPERPTARRSVAQRGLDRRRRMGEGEGNPT